jgi:hypothetical protein
MQMTIGLLWQDHGTAKLEVKVGRAAAGFEKRLGFRPTLCYISSSVIEEGAEVDGIRILRLKRIQRNNFWLGVPDERSRDVIRNYHPGWAEEVSKGDPEEGDRGYPESSEGQNGPASQRRYDWTERERHTDNRPADQITALDAGSGNLSGKTI